MCLYGVGTKYQVVSAKAVVRIDFPADALSMHKQNPFRIMKGNNSIKQNWSLAHICFVNVLLDINVFTKFDEIPLLPVQDAY